MQGAEFGRTKRGWLGHEIFSKQIGLLDHCALRRLENDAGFFQLLGRGALSILDANGGLETAVFLGLVRLKSYPTEPSISSSIRRLSSTLYSIGNWRTRSLTKPLTLRLIACASVRPRCCM